MSVDTRYVPSYRGFTPDGSRMSSAFKGQHARHGMRTLAFLAFLTGLQRAICTWNHVPIDCLLLPLIGVSQACFDGTGYMSDKCCVLKADYLPPRAHVATACINVSFEDSTLRPLPTCPATLPPSLECTPRFSRRLIALVWSTVPHLHTLAEPCCIAAVS